MQKIIPDLAVDLFYQSPDAFDGAAYHNSSVPQAIAYAAYNPFPRGRRLFYSVA